MKKIVVLFVSMLVLATTASAGNDKPIQVSQLPQTAQQFIKKYFGELAPISVAGVNSMDVLLPSISRYSGKEMIPIAILHGILIDISVPVFVSFFCNL